MKGEGCDLPENLGRDEPERRRRSASGREHFGERDEAVARVVGERARRLHALEVWVYGTIISWTNAGGRPRSAQQKPTKKPLSFVMRS